MRSYQQFFAELKRRRAGRARAGSRWPLIDLDTSFALAQLLAEDRPPPAEMWEAGVATGFELYVTEAPSTAR